MRYKTTALILAFLLGGLGIHHLYLGNYVRGVLYLAFCWTFVPVIISMVDFLLLLLMKNDTFNRRYNI